MRRIIVWGGLGFMALLLLNCMGLGIVGDIVLYLALGWVLFIHKNLLEMRISGVGLLSSAVCLILFATGLHLFLGWVREQMQREGGAASSSPWKRSWTTSLVAVILLMFVAGLTSVGIAHQTGWLITSRGPFVSGSTAVYRSQSVRNLKQIALALHNYHKVMATFPPGGTFDLQGRAHHGWQTLMLAQMENQALYNQINFDLPWNDRSNSTSFRTVVEDFLNPGIYGFEKDREGYALSHYAGNALVLGGDKNRALKEMTDGAGQTIMTGEAPANFKPWGHPTNWRGPAQGINRSLDGFGGPYKYGANFLFVDGSVRFLKNSISPPTWKALMTPNGGEEISVDAY